MRKELFLIPGGFEDAKTTKYFEITKILSKSGYTVILVPIVWKYKTMKEYVE